jgi:hypothetical protein
MLPGRVIRFRVVGTGFLTHQLRRLIRVVVNVGCAFQPQGTVRRFVGGVVAVAAVVVAVAAAVAAVVAVVWCLSSRAFARIRAFQECVPTCFATSLLGAAIALSAVADDCVRFYTYVWCVPGCCWVDLGGQLLACFGTRLRAQVSVSWSWA